MNILVTGGSGSFGQAFVRDALQRPGVHRVVVYSRDEWKQSQMAEEFPYTPGGKIRYFLGDVRDPARLHRAMEGIEFVVHAAALKRVDAVAYNPSEVVATNVSGTQNVVNAALDHNVAKVILISSDKAVMATNIYGASKFMAEQYAICANSYRGEKSTRISVVRWGNVMGSRGSVLNIFKEKHRKGQALLITHPDCTRFFITMRQAVSFTWYAHGEMHGGEIFIPLLPTFMIYDLAIAVSGEHPNGIMGLRAGGEKIHESLINPEEATRAQTTKEGFIVLGTKGFGLGNEFTYQSDSTRYTLPPESLKLLLKQEGLL